MVNGRKERSKDKDCIFTPIKTCFQETGPMVRNMAKVHTYSMRLE